MITVGLLWHSLSSDNLGVGALTQSQIALCAAAARQANVDIEFVMFGTVGRRNYKMPNAIVHEGGRISIKKMILCRSAFINDLNACDIVFDIGEGDSFTDIYGIKRFLFLAVSKIAVLIKGKPLVLSPQTIGPFDSWMTRKIAASIMRRCHKVFSRDRLSSNYLDSLQVNKNAVEVIDLAFHLPYVKTAHDENGKNGKVRIGVNVSGLLFSGGYSGDNQFGLSLDYAALIRRVLETWANDPQLEVWLIPHVIPDDIPNDDDRISIAKLILEFPSARRAPNFEGPSDAKSFISGMDFVIGARMHACIAALSSGVAVVPIAYSRKFNGLFDVLGYPYYIDAKAQDLNQAYNDIIKFFDNRLELTQFATQARLLADKKLLSYKSYLVEQFIRIDQEKKGQTQLVPSSDYSATSNHS